MCWQQVNTFSPSSPQLRLTHSGVLTISPFDMTYWSSSVSFCMRSIVASRHV